MIPSLPVQDEKVVSEFTMQVCLIDCVQDNEAFEIALISLLTISYLI